MEAGLLLVTVFCMTILAFIQTNQSFIVVYPHHEICFVCRVCGKPLEESKH